MPDTVWMVTGTIFDADGVMKQNSFRQKERTELLL